MRRDATIEWLRFVLMFLICLIHAVGYVPARWDHWLTNVCFMGVLGFVLISGYFGIRFSWSKIVRLEGVGIGCAMTVVAVSLLFDPANRSAARVLGESVRLWKGYWFIHAYVVMMILAPLVEPLFSHSSAPSPHPRSVVLPFILMVYGWSFLMLVPGIQKFVPRTPGLEAFSGMTLFAVYLVGRLYRFHDLDAKLQVRWVLPVTLAAGLVSACVIPPTNGWGGIFARYNSPSLLVFAVGFFWLFRRMGRGRGTVEKVEAAPTTGRRTALALMGPSIFSVYLIHCNDYGYRVFAAAESWLAGQGVGAYGLYLALAAGAFAAGFLLDVPRRLLVAGLERVLPRGLT